MTLQKEELIIDTNNVLILGSSSVARKELLHSVGIFPDEIVVLDVDESLGDSETAELC